MTPSQELLDQMVMAIGLGGPRQETARIIFAMVEPAVRLAIAGEQRERERSKKAAQRSKTPVPECPGTNALVPAFPGQPGSVLGQIIDTAPKAAAEKVRVSADLQKELDTLSAPMLSVSESVSAVTQNTTHQASSASAESGAPKPRTRKEYSASFEAFWSASNGKGSKWNAFQEYLTATKNVSHDVLMAAVAWQSKTPDWTRDNGKWRLDTERWLKRRRWEDAKPQKPAYAGLPYYKKPEPI